MATMLFSTALTLLDRFRDGVEDDDGFVTPKGSWSKKELPLKLDAMPFLLGGYRKVDGLFVAGLVPLKGTAGCLAELRYAEKAETSSLGAELDRLVR